MRILHSFLELIAIQIGVRVVLGLFSALKHRRFLRVGSGSGERSTWGERAVQAWPVCLLFAVSIWIVAPCFVAVPLSHDHPVHIFQAWHFWSELLGRGRIKGWSHFWGFGYPAGELTPFGPDLWVALFRAMTLGLLSWARTYALAFAGVIVFATGAVYWFTKRFFGVPTAVIAALFWLLDPGAFYQGGWLWHTTYGVWPVTLGLGFTLLALGKLDDLIAGNRSAHRRHDTVWATSWLFISLITHQLSIVIYPIAVPLLFMGHALGRVGVPPGAWRRVGGCCALGFGLAAFYVVPMLARSSGTVDLGVLGIPLDELGHRLVEFRAFENMWAPFPVLAIVGAVLVLGQGNTIPGAVFMTSGAVLFVVLSSDILVNVLHVERLMKGILKLEAARMLLVAKVFLFPLAAHAVVTTLRRSVGEVYSYNRSPTPIRTIVGVVLIAALGAPLFRPTAMHIYETQIAKTIQTADATPYWHDLQPFLEWSRAQRVATKDFYRIAYALPMHDHLSTIAPVFDHTLYYKVGYTPVQQFVSFPMSGEPALLEALSVKYFVTDHVINDPAFQPERSFGQLQVYRFARYRREPFTVIGPGRADVLRFDPEYIQIRLQGTAPGSRLKLHVADYPRWEATQAGQTLPITQVAVHGAEYPILMEVPIADGDVVFRYVRRGPDRAGIVISLLSLIVFVLTAVGGVRSAKARRFWATVTAHLDRPNPWRRRIVVGLGLVTLVIVARKLILPPQLASDSAFLLTAGKGTISHSGIPCVSSDRSSWQCGPDTLHWTVASGSYGSHLCMTAPASGPLVLASTTDLGRFIEGRYDPGGGDGRIQVTFDEHPVADMATRGPDQGLQFIQFDTRPWMGKVGRLRIEIRGAPLHCFDLKFVR